MMAPTPFKLQKSFLFLLLPLKVISQLNHLYPPTYTSNPIARHVCYSVAENSPGVATLAGYEKDGHSLEYYITSLPAVGRLYEVSQNYRSYGTEPKNSPTPIQGHQLPFLVTDQLFRVAYIPPANVFAPVGRWSSFGYVVKDTVTNILSEPGRCVLANAGGVIVGSSFTSGVDGWTIEGNLQQTTPVHQPFAWGLLNRYIYGTDEVNYVDFATGVDRQSWYFVAPASYSAQDMATAYGGTLEFSVKATYGDFDYLNTPPALNWIQLDCLSCNDGLGLRVVRQVDSFFSFNGEEQRVQIQIMAGKSWVRDPLNGALAYTPATACEIAATLDGLTKLKILGDFTKSGEGVALDDVVIVRSPIQPSFPLECQQGCTCRHYPTKRMSCCGNTVQVISNSGGGGARRLEEVDDRGESRTLEAEGDMKLAGRRFDAVPVSMLTKGGDQSSPGVVQLSSQPDLLGLEEKRRELIGESTVTDLSTSEAGPEVKLEGFDKTDSEESSSKEALEKIEPEKTKLSSKDSKSHPLSKDSSVTKLADHAEKMGVFAGVLDINDEEIEMEKRFKAEKSKKKTKKSGKKKKKSKKDSEEGL